MYRFETATMLHTQCSGKEKDHPGKYLFLSFSTFTIYPLPSSLTTYTSNIDNKQCYEESILLSNTTQCHIHVQYAPHDAYLDTSHLNSPFTPFHVLIAYLHVIPELPCSAHFREMPWSSLQE